MKTNKQTRKNENGSAIIVALLIMILLMGFVALAISRTTSETVAASNDAAESRTFEAAHASLEVMTQNFDKVFDVKLTPDSSDLTRIKSQKPSGFETDYEFQQNITQTEDTKSVVMTGEMFQGLNALRDKWQIDSMAIDRSNGVQVALRRNFLNNRIPIFQFGIFYDDDLEFHPGPRFDFGGRVHSNGSLFLMAQTGLYFSSKVTAVDHVFTDVARNGFPSTTWGDSVFVRNASGTYVRLRSNMGSVLASGGGGGAATNAPEYPATNYNTNWTANENQFQGNLLANRDPLNLPIKINSDQNGLNVDYVELIKRGKAVGDVFNAGGGSVASPNIQAVTNANADDQITAKERYYNKTGIRISLADKKERLPKCAANANTPVATDCGVRLDGKIDGTNAALTTGEARGYAPRQMADGYRSTRINGERFYLGREMWIKIETVGYNPSTQVFETKDITQDILSLGVTEAAPAGLNLDNYGTNDSRSVVKLQRFAINGEAIRAADTNFYTSSTLGGIVSNYVLAAQRTVSSGVYDPRDNGTCSLTGSPTSAFCKSISSKNYGDHNDHWKKANFGSPTVTENFVVPFPINMFDVREGLNYERNADGYNYNTLYENKIPWNGVLSMVDLDVGNLRNFLEGDYDGDMPTGTPFAAANGATLQSTDIPSANGWVLYISDRRGDYDFDGEYDMEDVFGVSGTSGDVVRLNSGNDGTLQGGEDLNGNGTLQYDFLNEAVRYRGDYDAATNDAALTFPDVAAVLEHKFYRRGVRLVNGRNLPGKYDSATAINTKGFTVASENGVYVLGNYNATGIANVGTPTVATDYLPQGTTQHIPASIAADAVTILSNNWNDAKSFRHSYALGSRVASETTVRFALLSGDTKSSLNGDPNQGGGDPRLAGGVHNFKRFLENWGSVRLNYSGSLINLYNSHNNNGTFKCCRMVYGPPTRNWVFDSSFLNPSRLPPGTPFFQSIQLTGFQRLN